MGKFFRFFKPSIFVIAIILFSLLYTINNVAKWKKTEGVISWDIIDYYGYLPSTFIYKDLTLKFIDTYKGPNKFIIWYSNAPNGGRVFKMSMGLSVLYCPFFFLGHIAAKSLGFDASGYSMPYQFFLEISSIFYLIFGLIILRKVLLKYFTEWSIALTFVGIVFGTNLFYYSSIEAPYSHSYSFFLFSVFIYLSIRWHEKPKLGTSLFLGLVLGLISLIRPTNIIIIIFFALFKINTWSTFVYRLKNFTAKYYLLLIIGISCFLIWIPQLLYWKHITGQWFYYSYGNETFYFKSPHIINGLIGYRKGWLTYAPIMVISLFGLLVLFRRCKDYFWATLIFIGLNIYIVFSWWCWWYGGSFGMRSLIESYSLLAFPFAAFIEWSSSRSKAIKIAIFSLFGLLVLKGVFGTSQYYYGAIHWDSMSKAAYWDSFFRIHPSAKFPGMLEEPDYDKAKLGIQEIKKKEAETIEKIPDSCINCSGIICDVEAISSDNKYFTSNCPSQLFENPGIQTNEKSHSGKYSVKISKVQQFGLTTRIDSAFKGCTYCVSVWKYGEERIGNLVISSINSDEFYIAKNSPVKKDGHGWELLVAKITIPTELKKNKLLIYVYNPTETPVYFDDLKICRIK